MRETVILVDNMTMKMMSNSLWH